VDSKPGVARLIMTRYYKKYAYAVPGARRNSVAANAKAREFGRIRLAFLAFNIIASLVSIAMAITIAFTVFS
jgi:hypothetical protein